MVRWPTTGVLLWGLESKVWKIKSCWCCNVFPPNLGTPNPIKYYGQFEKSIFKVGFIFESKSKVHEGCFGPRLSWTWPITWDQKHFFENLAYPNWAMPHQVLKIYEAMLMRYHFPTNCRRAPVGKILLLVWGPSLEAQGQSLSPQVRAIKGFLEPQVSPRSQCKPTFD